MIYQAFEERFLGMSHLSFYWTALYVLHTRIKYILLRDRAFYVSILLYCYEDENFIFLFENIKISNCTKLHIFAQFGHLNTTEMSIFSYIISHKTTGLFKTVLFVFGCNGHMWTHLTPQCLQLFFQILNLSHRVRPDLHSHSSQSEARLWAWWHSRPFVQRRFRGPLE